MAALKNFWAQMKKTQCFIFNQWSSCTLVCITWNLKLERTLLLCIHKDSQKYVIRNAESSLLLVIWFIFGLHGKMCIFLLCDLRQQVNMRHFQYSDAKFLKFPLFLVLLSKEVQIIHRLFLVIYYLLHGKIWGKTEAETDTSIYYLRGRFSDSLKWLD